MNASCLRRSIACRITGAVQGVGFRPYVFRLARELGLDGWIRNDSTGVELQLAGETSAVSAFLERLPREAPAAARIMHVTANDRPDEPIATGFSIRESRVNAGGHTSVMADLATCPDCLREIFDPANRRFRYPFTNCTNCGPRYSIVTAIPYDRVNTTMAAFTMCPRCRAEYENPADRRFHAQPNACPACGPHLCLQDRTGHVIASEDMALRATALALRRGNIVALKGIGGYHLLADASSQAVVTELRRRKHRPSKPLAVMFPSIFSLDEYCVVSAEERALLCSPAAPIVLLTRRSPSNLAEALAPYQPTLGALLPYSPLHHLLLAELGIPIVATSGNLSEEPICHEDQDAFERLGAIADLFLFHDRPIVRPVDDSVAVIAAGRPLLLRRSRGYTPLPLQYAATPDHAAILAVGGHLKNSPSLAAGGSIHPGPHVGDLGTEASRYAFEHAAASLPALFDTVPATYACDLHPDYGSTAFALAHDAKAVRVQHHHAHILSVMAEHNLNGEVTGVAWDGTGYGPDGTVWGGEFMVADASGFRRIAYMRPFPLPGGDAAVCEPRRSAVGLLFEALGPAVFTREDITLRRLFTDAEWATLRDMLTRGIQCPRTSSAGRLFDAVAALMGLASVSAYEGQAATLLEHYAAEDADSTLPLSLREDGTIDWAPMLPALLDFLPRIGNADRPEFQSLETRVGMTCSAFHNALARMMVTVAQKAGLKRVVLGGGCFQNVRLLETAITRLRAADFEVYWPRELPPNDGGLAVGQLWAALHQTEDTP